MDENKSTEKTKVGFPAAAELRKNGGGKVISLIVIILVILGGATWYLLSRREETIEFTNDSITPFAEQSELTPIENNVIDKKALKIQILNGTGTPGDAGKLETALNELGYSEITTGNADNYDYATAIVTFASDFPENYKSEIKEKLLSMYSSVEEGTSTLGDYSAVVITGKAKGTSTKSTTPTKKPTLTATPSARLTPTPTVTPTP